MGRVHVISLRHIALVNSAAVNNGACHYPGALCMDPARIAVARNGTQAIGLY